MDEWKLFCKFSILLILLTPSFKCSKSSEELEDFELDDGMDNIAEESSLDGVLPVYVIPKHIFNEGKPFYGEKDPISGKIDFNIKKLNANNNYEQPIINNKETDINFIKPNDINQITPNFHDYLNLPVKYSSSKSVYPLVSSSYANLKYQGNNKNYTSNHKNYTTSTTTTSTTTTTTTPKYYTQPPKSLPTKYNSPKITSGNVYNKMTPGPIQTTARPPFQRPSPSRPSFNNQPTTAVRFPNQNNGKNVTFTKPTPSSNQQNNKKPIPLDSAGKPNSNKNPNLPKDTLIHKFTEEVTRVEDTTTKNGSNILSLTTTNAPKNTNSSVTNIPVSTSTTVLPSRIIPSGFRPIPTEQLSNTPQQQVPVNNTDLNKINKKDPSTMSLADLFNSLTDDDYEDEYPEVSSATPIKVASSTIPSMTTKPAMSSPTPAINKKTNIIKFEDDKTTQYNYQNSHQPGDNFAVVAGPVITPYKPNHVNMSTITESVKNDDESVRNEYVKYEVQKPSVNMLQFKPVSSMNNIIISPDQNEATFVLGSQQSVGIGNFIGTKDNFSKGQVIPVQGNIQQGQGHIVSQGQGQLQGQQNQGQILQVQGNIQQGQVILGQGQVLPAQPQQVPNNQNQFANTFNDIKYQSLNRPHGFTASTNINIQPQDYKTTNVRFPNESEIKYREPPSFDDAPIVTGTYSNDITIPNGHSAPIALPQNQNQNKIVVFPPNDKLSISETVNTGLGVIDVENDRNENTNVRVVFDQEEQPSDYQNQVIPSGQDQILQLNGQPSYHTLPDDLTPPNESEPNRQAPQNMRPGFTRPPPFAYNEFVRKSPPNGQYQPRPNPERLLPNILPQFRPNAKASNHGLPPKDIGAIRLQPNQQNGQAPGQFNRRPNQQDGPNNRPPPPPFVMRRTPIPNRFNTKISPPLDQMDPNRRLYKVPSQHGGPQIQDRIFNNPPPPQQQYPPTRRYVDGYPLVQRPPIETQPMPQQKYDSLNSSPFANDDFYNNPPSVARRPVENQNNDNQKLEPVVTLQMIQSKKQVGGVSVNLTTPVRIGNEEQFYNPQQQPPQSFSQVASGSGKSPVYVVYPVKSPSINSDIFASSESSDAVVVGQRGDQSPIPPAEINNYPSTSTKNDYQNTPFTIIRNEQEPILMAKDKHTVKPTNNNYNKGNFPYALEKPDPVALSEMNQQHNIKKGQLMGYNSENLFNLGEEIHSKTGNQHGDYRDPMSSSLHRVTERPIAIAYTPTEPNHYYPDHYAAGLAEDDKFSVPNFGSPVISEIRKETQTESTYIKDETEDLSLSYPSRGQYYEQDFQAPFYPSVNLGTITDTKQGWAVVPPPSKASVDAELSDNKNIEHNNNKIDRSDDNIHHEGEMHHSEQPDVTTKKFDVNSFQPEYLSGFKPIYPSIAQKEQMQQQQQAQLKQSQPTQQHQDIIERTSSNSGSTSSFLDSLEALFADDDDEDDMEAFRKEVRQRHEHNNRNINDNDDEDDDADDDKTTNDSKTDAKNDSEKTIKSSNS